jgi:hypothetical protein
MFSSVRRLREFQFRDLRAGMSGLVKQSLPNICTGDGSPGHSSSSVVYADSRLEMSLKIQSKAKTRVLGVIGPNSSLASQRIPIGTVTPQAPQKPRMSLASFPTSRSIKLGNRNPYTSYNTEATTRIKLWLRYVPTQMLLLNHKWTPS